MQIAPLFDAIAARASSKRGKTSVRTCAVRDEIPVRRRYRFGKSGLVLFA
jgi:hypothetical protein